MKKQALVALISGLFLSLTTAQGVGQTAYRLSMSGIFNFEGPFKGHPDMDVGDSFTFFLDIDDSNVFGAASPLKIISSVLGGGLQVNGVAHPFVPPVSVFLQGDLPTGTPAILSLENTRGPTSALNAVSSNWAPVSSIYPTAVGPFPEFSEIPLWNSMNPASMTFRVQGGTEFDYISGPLSVFSVTTIPEPGGSLLIGLAGLALLRGRPARSSVRLPSVA